MPAPPHPTSLPSTSSSDPASKNTCERPRGHELGTWTSRFATRQPPCLPDGRPDLQRSFQFQYFPHITTVAYIPRPLNARPICRHSFSTEPASHSSDQSAPITTTTFAGGGIKLPDPISSKTKTKSELLLASSTPYVLRKSTPSGSWFRPGAFGTDRL